jgi:hypothetical protein
MQVVGGSIPLAPTKFLSLDSVTCLQVMSHSPPFITSAGVQLRRSYEKVDDVYAVQLGEALWDRET